MKYPILCTLDVMKINNILKKKRELQSKSPCSRNDPISKHAQTAKVGRHTYRRQELDDKQRVSSQPVNSSKTTYRWLTVGRQAD